MVLSGGSIKSADTPFRPPPHPHQKKLFGRMNIFLCECQLRPTGGTWPTLFGPWCGYCGCIFFSSGGSNESADTPFCPVSAAQVPQEVHGLHLLITGADAVGGTSQPIKIHAVWSTREWSTRVKICPAPKLYYMSDVIVTT